MSMYIVKWDRMWREWLVLDLNNKGVVLFHSKSKTECEDWLDAHDKHNRP